MKKYDKELLYKTKEIDVYSVIEACLDVPYDWKYLTPDQSILGLTAFNPGYIYTWPESHFEDGMLPQKTYLEKGTIVIDSTLTESSNRGRENFTVIHEVFHQVIHQKCFKREPADYAHYTTASAIKGQKKKLDTALDIIEYQANSCAAAFLMPENLVREIFHKQYNKSEPPKAYMVDTICERMAPEFNVSKTERNLQNSHPLIFSSQPKPRGILGYT